MTWQATFYRTSVGNNGFGSALWRQAPGYFEAIDIPLVQLARQQRP
jgi:hypothetical protein